MSATVPSEIVNNVQRAVKQRGLRQIAREAGVSHSLIQRVLAGRQASADTITALSRIAPRVRTAEEFRGAPSAAVRAPQLRSGPYSWSLETIRGARDAQVAGDFELPVRLAEGMRTDDALFVAYHNRIAPQSCVQTKLVPASGARGKATAAKAAQSVFVSRSVLEGVTGTLANHGIAIGYNEYEPTDDGTRIDFRLTEWPLEAVKYNKSTDILEASTRDGGRVEIRHGDGRWVIFRKFLVKPWTQEACILPAALIWAAHANAVSDHASASRAHGLAKIMGELPEGVALGDGVTLTDEASMFLAMLRDLASGDAVAGIRPAGAKTDFLANGSTAWQVFTELELGRAKAAARVYLGTDAMLGSVGGAPGVDIATLFGVATTKVQGDFAAIETALSSGVYEPWAAINDGSSRYAPRLEYQMPDPDAAAKSAERATAYDRLFATIERMRANGFDVNQSTVNRVAADVGVSPAPVLAGGLA